MKSVFVKSAALAAAITSLSAVSATASVWVYDLLDHPDGHLVASQGHAYGLRLDAYDRVFSFENGGAAQLAYDDVANTVTIAGSMIESLGGNTFGSLATVSYTINNVTNAGAGEFVVGNPGGSGSIDGINLGAAADGAGNTFYFLDNGYRLAGQNSGFVGRGWVQKDPGANDFLFQATLNRTDSQNLPPIPLPAAGWMLIAGLGGLGAMRRAGKKKA